MINEIVNELLKIGLAHESVNQSKHKPVSEFNGMLNKKYMFYLVDTNIPRVQNAIEQTVTYTIQTYLFDRYSNKERRDTPYAEKDDQIFTIMTQIVEEFIERYENSGSQWKITDEAAITVDVFDRQHLDMNIGVQVTLVINIPYACAEDGIFMYD